MSSTSKDAFVKYLFFTFLQVLTLTLVYSGGQTLRNYDDSSVLVTGILLIIPQAFLIVKYPHGLPRFFYVQTILILGCAWSFALPLSVPAIARDGPHELHILNAVSLDGAWDPDYMSPLGATSSVGIFLPMMSLILGVAGFEFYTFSGPILVPLIGFFLFEIFRNHTSLRKSFCLALFAVLQVQMILSGLGSFRIYLGLFFFTMLVWTFTNGSESLQNYGIRVFSLVGLVGSYYAASYLVLVIVSLAWLLGRAGRLKSRRSKNALSATKFHLSGFFVLLCGILTYLWYSQDGSLLHISTHITRGLSGLGEMFNFGVRGELEQKALGLGLNVADAFTLVMQYLVVGLAFFGTLAFIRSRNTRSFSSLRRNETYMSFVYATLLAIGVSVLTPIIAVKGLGYLRIYQYMLLFLLPGLMIGLERLDAIISTARGSLARFRRGNTLSEWQSRDCLPYVVSMFLAFQLLSNAGMVYHVLSEEPLPVTFNNSGSQYESWSLREVELSASEWLLSKSNPPSTIHGDRYISSRLAPYWKNRFTLVDGAFFSGLQIGDHEYVFLRYQNVVDGTVSLVSFSREEPILITSFGSDLVHLHRIYSNNGSEVLMEA